MRDLNFPRAPAAVEAGLHGAFAFPIHFGGEVVGVVEFFSRDPREPDADLRALAAAVGSQLGQYMERKRAEAELRATSERIRALIEVSPLPIVDITADRRVRMWNPAAEALFGWSADEVIGLPLPIVPEDRADEHRAVRERTTAGELVVGFETKRRRKDGSLVDVSLSTAPIRDASGAVTDNVGFIVEIGERKRHEDGLRFLAEARAPGGIARLRGDARARRASGGSRARGLVRRRHARRAR
jgi:PAS domain S-box-containing protein